MVETGKDLEFFKVFLPEFSSHELVIPPAFIDLLLGKPLPTEVFLLDEIGRLWRVETETEDTDERFCVLFKKGWESFAKDQSLEFGDFLVFRYDGDSRFSVTIFAQDGIKKDVCVVTTTEGSRVSVDNEPVDDIFTKPESRKDCGNKRKREHDSVNDKPDQYESTSKTKPEHRDKTQRTVNRAGDPCDISWFPEDGVEESVYKPKNPHFLRNITSSSYQKLEIPTTFLKSNGIELEEELELRDEDGKKWPLKVENHGRGQKFSFATWSCFCKSQKLRKNHKFLLEFIVPRSGRCNEIQVRVISGRLPTTMTTNKYQVHAM
ncbi:PREDICTED: putative B3 domain-containing protein At5g66980 [Camelina sativa]|uniref:B3 domain-containing protein At5g66980 n=1 Tax=Camelina sativa TaxID=90675 RepID=A0ABM0UTV3_CAMSA|nr:PREDICTED: putative B3 domain-containing protein At5g66980 [Camelina sativa]